MRWILTTIALFVSTSLMAQTVGTTVVRKPVDDRLEKVVFSFVASSTGFIYSVTSEKLLGDILMVASIPSSGTKKISATACIEIVDDTHRDIMGGMLSSGGIEENSKKYYYPVGVGSVTEPLFINSTLSIQQNQESGFPDTVNASHTIEIYVTKNAYKVGY